MKTHLTPKWLLLLLFFSFSVVYSFSQLNQWTWMKGSNIVNSLGFTGTQNIPGVLNNPAARDAAAYWKDNEGNFWVFGGISSFNLTTRGDLWKFNPATLQWALIVPENLVQPTARFSASFWTDNAGNLWLFGGFGFSSTGLQSLTDLWKFSPYSNLWTLVNGNTNVNQHGIYGELGVASDISIPGSRYQSTYWTDNTGDLWLFGGIGYAASNPNPGQLNDLWKYNISSNMWTWIKGDSVVNAPGVYGTKNLANDLNKPGARFRCNHWVDQSNNLWLYGGSSYNDLWKYNITTNQWVWVNGDNSTSGYSVYGTNGIPDPLNKPGSNNAAVSWTDLNGDLWMFGGRGYSDTQFGDLNGFWKYNIQNDVWTFVMGNHATYTPGIYGMIGVPDPANIPGSREDACGWIDGIGNLWMFGGTSFPPSGGTHINFNDVWKFTLNIVVPVKLISFTGKSQNENAFLNWVVENETDLDHYEIERSMDAYEFKKAGQVKALHIKDYSFSDDISDVSGDIVYYRLRMVDIDGNFSYSNIIKLRNPLNATLSLYPNPANTYTQLKFNKTPNGKVYVEISDAAGKIVFRNNYQQAGNIIYIPTNKLPVGTYPVTVVYNGERCVKSLTIIK